jgi:protein-L-isoaspartate O-methyltransferase
LTQSPGDQDVTSLDAIYASHPLNERTLLARIERQGIPFAGLTEWSLAIDPDTGITDQNHPGGVEAVLTLAVAAKVSLTSTVVDVGAGLGGPARVLAQAFGCSVVGIEQDQNRYEAAVRLTERVGLGSRVTFLRHDALSGTAGLENIDVLWGQSAWVHFPNPDAFLDLWTPTLRPGGRVVMSDTFLLRKPSGSEELHIVRSLEKLWGAHLLPIDRWQSALRSRRCAVMHVHDHTSEARAHFRNCLSVSSKWPNGTVTAAETHSWLCACEGLERRLIGTRHLIAIKDS